MFCKESRPGRLYEFQVLEVQALGRLTRTGATGNCNAVTKRNASRIQHAFTSKAALLVAAVR